MTHEFHNPDGLTPEPKTFTAHGHTWFRHTPGDPMPCDGGRITECLWRAELEGTYLAQAFEAREWNWGADPAIPDHHIIGWRYADKTPSQTDYAAPPVKHPEVAELQARCAEPQGTKWQGHPKGNDSTPTDNDAWESLLHTNATLGREVSRLRAEVEALKATLNQIREALK